MAGPPFSASSATAMPPAVAASRVSTPSWIQPVMTLRSRSSASTRTFTLSRPPSTAAAIRSTRRGSRRSIGSRATISSAAASFSETGRQALGQLGLAEPLGLRDDVEAGREQGQAALQRGQRPEGGRELRRDGQFVPGHQAEQVGEHGGVGRAPGGQVPDEQRPDRPFQRLLVQVVGTGGHLEQGVGHRHRVTPVDGEHQPLQGGAQPGVQAADRAEVDQPQPPVGEQQDVARMRVGVEDAVDDDLPQQAVEQVTGQPLAIAVGQRVRRRPCSAPARRAAP